MRSLFILAPLLALLACSGEDKSAAAVGPRVVEVGFVTLRARSVTVSRQLAGRTNAFLTSEVRPQITGIIKSRKFTEGSEVKRGQALYQIDGARYRAARNEAKAALDTAQTAAAALESRAERYRALRGSKAVSAQQSDDVIAAAAEAKARVEQARAALQTAALNLAYTKISAPISGRIGRSLVTVGALVTSNQSQALATIQELDPIYVDITQSSAELLELRRQLAKGAALPAKASLTLTLEDGTDYDHPGTLEFAEAMVDESTGSVTLRAKFPNPDKTLLPGMFVRVSAPQAVLPKAVLAPQQGITRDPRGRATAFVVGKGDIAELRTVTTGQAIGDQWLILDGLQAGDRLIVEGTSRIRPGVTVKPVTVDLEKHE